LYWFTRSGDYLELLLKSDLHRAMAEQAPLSINSKLCMNSGHEIPVLGYGVYQTPADVCEKVVQHAFKVGYRHVDSAASYRNERPCGRAIARSHLPRSSIFFTSKIPTGAMSYAGAKKQIETTLHESGLSYINLMLLHAPYGGSAGRKGAWRALVEAKAAGKVRSIGVSNYGVHHLQEMEDHMAELEEEFGPGAGGQIDVGQWEIHPWLAREDIASYCRQRGIVVEAYCPLVRGERMREEVLKPLMKKHGKTAAQILLRWSLQKGYVPLPKSVTPSRIEENAEVFDFELSDKEMETLVTGEYAPCTWDPTGSPLGR